MADHGMKVTFRRDARGRVSAEQWADDVRLSDIEPQFVCSVCGLKGAAVRADRTVR